MNRLIIKFKEYKQKSMNYKFAPLPLWVIKPYCTIDCLNQ